MKKPGDLDIDVGFGSPPDVLISDYHEDIYQHRDDVDGQARAAFESKHRALILRGHRETGKTRIMVNILRDDSNALVIIPRKNEPPAFSAGGLSGRTVYLVFDDLH